jgi:CubicO group peptidase (beta-lactamase class C family)
VYEGYWLGASRSSQWSVWSITKSFVSALVGVAVAEAAIASVLDPVDKYVPELSRGAYAGVSIRDVLQMSSGVAWCEDYSDPGSDIRKSASGLSVGESRDDLARTGTRACPPGSYHRYNSLDTHVLGMVLRRATRTPLTIYLRDKLWHPLGMESDAFWIVDGRGLEWAEGGLNLCLRDLARFGLLYANRGRVADRPVLSPEWIAASTTPDAPHLRPGARAASSSVFGYGYQWWIPDDSGAFCAMGVYNQFLYIDPRTNVIIAKFSAPRGYALDASPDSYREPEHMACFRAICDALA